MIIAACLAGFLFAAEPDYDRIQKIDFRGRGGKPYAVFFGKTAVWKDIEACALSPAGVLVVYDGDERLILME